MAVSVLYTNFGGSTVHHSRDDGSVEERFYVSDTLGSTVKLADESGTVTDTMEFWPYGEEYSRIGSTETPFTWVGTRGYYKDAAKRFYVRMRSYASDIGSWLRVDPLWPHEMAYQYANSPISVIDYWGEKVYTEKECEIIHDGWVDTCEKDFQLCGGTAAILGGLSAACLALLLAPEPVASKILAIVCGIICIGLVLTLLHCLPGYKDCRGKADAWYIRCLARANGEEVKPPAGGGGTSNGSIPPVGPVLRGDPSRVL